MYGERCVALVAETRTSFNHVRYDFFEFRRNFGWKI